MLRILILILSFLALNFKASAQDVSVADIKGFSIEKMEGKEVFIKIEAHVKNPTNKKIGLTVKKGSFYKDGEYYGSFKPVKKIKLPKGHNELLTIPVKVTMKKEIDLVKEGVQMFMGKRVELKVTGNLKATWFIFWKKYPFEYQEKLSLKSFMK